MSGEISVPMAETMRMETFLKEFVEANKATFLKKMALQIPLQSGFLFFSSDVLEPPDSLSVPQSRFVGILWFV